MKKRNMLIVAMAAALCFAAPMATQAAEPAAEGGSWQSDATGWWYKNSDSSYLNSGFYEITENGNAVTYYFNGSGYLQTGWIQTADGWYYANPSGVIQTGWQAINGNWYFLDPEGYTDADGKYIEAGLMCANEWAYLYPEGNYEAGKWYFFKPGGAMVTGWYNTAGSEDVYGNWMYMNADGTMYDGWLADGGKWYYIDEGRMAASQWIYNQETGKKQHYVGRDGAMVYGWYYTSYEDATGYTSNTWRYTNPADGSYYTGWVADGSKWYYIDTDGIMLRDVRRVIGTLPQPSDYNTWEEYNTAYNAYVKNNTYIFDASGAMVTGWYASKDTYGTTWYYAGADGRAYDGWLAQGTRWYYISNGVMVTNTAVKGGYVIGMDGAMIQ